MGKEEDAFSELMNQVLAKMDTDYEATKGIQRRKSGVNPLLQFDNVLITPHLAAFAQESVERSRAFAIYNTSKVTDGGEPESIVLPD